MLSFVTTRSKIMQSNYTIEGTSIGIALEESTSMGTNALEEAT
jgi:hypothetical protein